MTATTATQGNTGRNGSTQANRLGGAQDMLNQNLGKAKAFAKARPAATAALAGVVGLALLNTLRGR